MNFKSAKILSSLILSGMLLIGCGSGSDSSPDSNTSPDLSTSLSLVKTYEINTMYDIQSSANVFLDGDSLVLVGGENWRDSGPTYNGSLSFSNKIISIDLNKDTNVTLEMNASGGEGFEAAVQNGGRGNNKIQIHKLSANKYLVCGGYQYAATCDIVDFQKLTTKTISTNMSITDTQYQGLNTTPFYTNAQANAMLDNGNIMYFGLNNGLYGMDTIMQFNILDENFSLSSAKLGLARSHATAYKLKDGRVIIIGGWDGSAQTTPDSATRRVEIFNPSDNTVTRVANFPIPYSNGQDVLPLQAVDDTGICTQGYQYAISSNTWSTGCTISNEAKKIKVSNNSYLPYEFTQYGYLIGKLSNGNLVFFENGDTGSNPQFSDTVNGYPIVHPSKIKIYKSN